MRRSTLVVLLLAPLSLAAARDPSGDVRSCAGGAPVVGPTADLVAVDAFADELGTAAVWRMRFARPIPVPDASGAPLRIDVLVRDPKLPTVSVGDERGMNRIVRWDDTGADRPIDVVWLDHGGHTPFNPPVIEGSTIELRVPGRILLGEAGDGTESVRRTRWSVVVRDGTACDRLGDRPTLRLREPTPTAETPGVVAPGLRTDPPGQGTPSGPFLWLAGASGLAFLLVAGLVWRRRTT